MTIGNQCLALENLSSASCLLTLLRNEKIQAANP